MYKITIIMSESQIRRIERLHEAMRDTGQYHGKLEDSISFAVNEGLQELERLYDSCLKRSATV